MDQDVNSLTPQVVSDRDHTQVQSLSQSEGQGN
jgi:hypothetical protein